MKIPGLVIGLLGLLLLAGCSDNSPDGLPDGPPDGLPDGPPDGLPPPSSEWPMAIGGTSNDQGYSVQQTTDGGYIIAGSTESSGFGGSDVYLVKTDADGNSEWAKAIGGTSNDQGYSVQPTEDGGYIIAGLIEFSGLGGFGGSDVYLIKTDADGNID